MFAEVPKPLPLIADSVAGMLALRTCVMQVLEKSEVGVQVLHELCGHV